MLWQGAKWRILICKMKNVITRLLIDLAASSDHGGLQDFVTVLWMLCNGKVSRSMTILLLGNLDSDWYKLYYSLQCFHVDGKNHPM